MNYFNFLDFSHSKPLKEDKMMSLAPRLHKEHKILGLISWVGNLMIQRLLWRGFKEKHKKKLKFKVKNYDKFMNFTGLQLR